MFTVSDVRHPFLLWMSVRLTAEADMSLTAQRLRVNGLKAPVLDTRVLRVKTGESFIINARKTDGFRIVDRVATKRPISRRWRTMKTA